MMKKLFTPRNLCLSALIAAVYAVLTLALPVLSYGEWQCRISEALTLLPILLPQMCIRDRRKTCSTFRGAAPRCGWRRPPIRFLC